MSRLFHALLPAVCILTITSPGDDRIRIHPGDVVDTFAATDVLTGKENSLQVHGPAPKATVIAFTSVRCPVAAVLAPRLVEISKEYGEKGVRFLFIDSNPGETADEFAEFAKNVQIKENALRDPEQKIADALGVTCTAEVLVIDNNRKLAYRGAVDDQYIPGARKPAPKRQYLIEALRSVLEGAAPAVKTTKPAGCLIGRERKDVKAAKVTYNKDVAPILQKHCVQCHQPGEVGPMSLLNYQNAADVSLMIGEVVDNGRMPPWHADPRFGKWSNERKLSDPEKLTIANWVKAGAPKGDGAEFVIKAPTAVEKSRWHIGEPDLVLRAPKQQIPEQGTMEYRYLNVDTALKEDRWIQAAEIHAGARQNVHHILVFCKYPKDRKSEEPPIDGGLEAGFFASLVPGDVPNVWPAGTGKLLPAGATLMFQIHYTASGIAGEDVSEIGLKFCKEKPKQIVTTRGITQHKLRIEPNDPAAKYSASWFVPKDITILGVSPHMHYRGKSFQFDITKDGKTETLLSVPKYDFNWQAVYHPVKPLAVGKTSVIKCTGVYDNSAANPANPNPNATVHFGEQSWDEMFIGYVDYVEDH
ncbi:MAG: redoxin domain-containing protein [Planctomycetes bacterium]|nr:redoxin domain-containing protein [Planctomycetota bacterium]